MERSVKVLCFRVANSRACFSVKRRSCEKVEANVPIESVHCSKLLRNRTECINAVRVHGGL